MHHTCGLIVPGEVVLALKVGEDLVEDGTGPGHTGDVLHGPALEVACPDADRELRGKAERPVVAIAGAGASLGRHPERQAQGRAQTEGEGPGLVVAQDVCDPPGVARIEQAHGWHCRCIGTKRPRQVLAKARKGRVGVRQFQQPDGRIANGEAKAVVIGGFRQRGDSQFAQLRKQRWCASNVTQHPHGRYVQGVAEGVAVGHRTVELVIIVFGLVEARVRLEFNGQVTDNGSGSSSAFKGQRIRERL